eukprot:c15883_g1_i1 orf=324-1511(+)
MSDKITRILTRRWLLPKPDIKLQKVFIQRIGGEREWSVNNFQFLLASDKGSLNSSGPGGMLYVVRDDLLHPIMGGNKLRKLDALLPVLQSASVTDVVTCGGCQSAHAAALAVACAEHGLRAHLLLRGEKLKVATGYNLIAGMYGVVSYIPRMVYADRENMLATYAERIAGSGSLMWLHKDFDAYLKAGYNESSSHSFQCQTAMKRVAIVREGAADAVALLGLIRLVEHLAQSSIFGEDKLLLVVDSGTGTTAIGLAIGIMLFELPWKVVGVMLVQSPEAYKRHGVQLLCEFNQLFSEVEFEPYCGGKLDKLIQWIDRRRPRKFGRVLQGELKDCRQIAQQTGILLDPIYTLSAWEAGMELSLFTEGVKDDRKVVILHTGGTMGLFGIAQRYPEDF